MSLTHRAPDRYVEYLKAVQVELPELGTIATAVGPRAILGWRWQCRRCLAYLKPNTAGAQAHLMKHARTLERARAKGVGR